MLFTLESLDAGKGDALLLHFGSPASPQLIVVDGGPAGIYRRVLKPRLEELRARRAPAGRLVVRMVMVSHMDDDHINGVLRMLTELDDLRADRKPQPYDILTLWHNSFDDILGNETDVLLTNLQPAAAAAAAGVSIPDGFPIHRDAALVLATVRQGRELRAKARALSIRVNEGFDDLVGVPRASRARTLPVGGDLSLTVIGPSKSRADELRAEWEREITRLGVAQQAAFADTSVYNLASIVTLATAGGKTMLLTGDARGDHLLDALTDAGLLNGGRCHVNLLKVPHHGSSRNVTTDFFRRVTADHYVISADGQNGNPDVAMLAMLSEARAPDDGFTVHLTNAEPRLEAFFAAETGRGRSYDVRFRDPRKRSLQIDLGDQLRD